VSKLSVDWAFSDKRRGLPRQIQSITSGAPYPFTPYGGNAPLRRALGAFRSRQRKWRWLALISQ